MSGSPIRFPLLTADDVSRLLGIPVSTVRAYAREGRLPIVPLGRRVMFNEPDVRAAVERAARSGVPL